MSDFEKNVNGEEIEELEDIIYTLTDEETGEEIDFQLIARATLDDTLYFALVPANDLECEEYYILSVREDGEDVILESIEDDDEWEDVAAYFDNEIFLEIDHDEA